MGVEQDHLKRREGMPKRDMKQRCPPSHTLEMAPSGHP